MMLAMACAMMTCAMLAVTLAVMLTFRFSLFAILLFVLEFLMPAFAAFFRYYDYSIVRQGETVTVSSGGIIDFDISALLPDNAALVNDLSLVGGTPAYTVTVSGTQTLGVYALADGAADCRVEAVTKEEDHV